MTTATLKISSTPPGEAPAWVREQWVGLSLPLAQSCAHAHTHATFGVLSRPRGRVGRLLARVLGKTTRKTGYVVESLSAINVLAQSSPEAAAWWRSNAPSLLQPGQYFVFQKGVGQVFPAGAP